MEATFDIPIGSIDAVSLKGAITVNGKTLDLPTPHALIVDRVSRRGRSVRYRICPIEIDKSAGADVV